MSEDYYSDRFWAEVAVDRVGAEIDTLFARMQGTSLAERHNLLSQADWCARQMILMRQHYGLQ